MSGSTDANNEQTFAPTFDQTFVCREITHDDLKLFEHFVAQEANGLRDAGLFTREQAKWERSFVSTMSLVPFYGGTQWGLFVPLTAEQRAEVAGQEAWPWGDYLMVSLNSTRLSTGKRKNAWGRYINFLLAYTLPIHRRQGYATALYRYVEGIAREQGYSRLKSLVQSWGGVRLHMAVGQGFWGYNVRGELAVDAPISDEAFPEGTPIEVRPLCVPPGRTTPMNGEELLPLLTSPEGIFKVPEAEARAALTRRGYTLND